MKFKRLVASMKNGRKNERESKPCEGDFAKVENKEEKVINKGREEKNEVWSVLRYKQCMSVHPREHVLHDFYTIEHAHSTAASAHVGRRGWFRTDGKRGWRRKEEQDGDGAS